MTVPEWGRVRDAGGMCWAQAATFRQYVRKMSAVAFELEIYGSTVERSNPKDIATELISQPILKEDYYVRCG